MKSVENVIGSEFDDDLTGPGGVARGLGGAETCSGFASNDCGGPSSPPASATLEGVGGDPGLLVRGGPGAESISVTADAAKVTVTSTAPLAAGPGCTAASALAVNCAAPAAPIGYATVWSGDGGDQLTLGPGFPVTASVVLDGGDGSDAIDGSPGSEILLAGPTGFDRLSAGGGDDALFSARGADVMSGGDGIDQLVTSQPCEGHDMSGGKGRGDIAGFGQTIDAGIVAQLGGVAFIPGAAGCIPTRVRADSEILEGTQNADVLYGTAGPDPLLLGNEGNDVIYGSRGADTLRGEQGKDSLFGGGGADTLEAFDRSRDAALNCGAGGNRVVRDRIDPRGRRCAKGERRKAKRGKKREGAVRRSPRRARGPGPARPAPQRPAPRW